MKTTNFKLKALRVENDLTQFQLSTILGMHKATYNRKEKGLTEFTISEAKALAVYFETTLDHIFLSN